MNKIRILFSYIKNKFKWEPGRSGGVYEKIKIFECLFPIGWDIHFIRIPEGGFIEPHVDPVFNKRHFRISILLRCAKAGGQFIAEETIINTKRFKFFRPDKFKHHVTKVERGERICLSIGWVF